MKTIAVLCAHTRSFYRNMENVEVYDRQRDARTFPGGMPVIAHPPCRAWSAFCAHQARPEPGEKELGLWCAEQVRRWGGILEQPAHSRLWEAAGLPLPGIRDNNLTWSIEVFQSWWGFPQKKATWLFFSDIPACEVGIPIRLMRQGGGRRSWQVMSKRQRSETCRPFAEWLVEMTRKAK